MTNMPDKIVLAKIITAMDLEFEEHCTTTMRVMTLIMTMAYQVHLRDLYAFMWCQQLRPPSTHGVEGDTVSHLSIHTKANKGRVAPLQSSLKMVSL